MFQNMIHNHAQTFSVAMCMLLSAIPPPSPDIVLSRSFWMGSQLRSYRTFGSRRLQKIRRSSTKYAPEDSAKYAITLLDPSSKGALHQERGSISSQRLNMADRSPCHVQTCLLKYMYAKILRIHAGLRIYVSHRPMYIHMHVCLLTYLLTY